MNQFDYVGRDVITDFLAVSVRDLRPANDGEYVELPNTGGSDYSGDTTTIANYKTLLVDYADLLGKSMWKITGGHYTYGLVFYWPSLTTEQQVQLEILDNALEDYPILDEMEWAEVENDLVDEAWDSWLGSDIQRHLNKLFWNEVSGWYVEFDNTPALREMTEAFMDKRNFCYEFETAGNVHLDIERLFPNAYTLYSSPSMVKADKTIEKEAA
jgi:hypothetical protein